MRRTHTILVAEENPATREFLDDNLTADGFFVLVAEDRAKDGGPDRPADHHGEGPAEVGPRQLERERLAHGRRAGGELGAGQLPEQLLQPSGGSDEVQEVTDGVATVAPKMQ